jgi:tetratricopeptide (TPR) repeat protein
MEGSMRIRRVALLPVLAALLLAAGCAGPAKLAQQSQEALAKGDLRKAYDKALRAVEKDPQNGAARAAYSEASARVADDYIARVRAQAATDSVRAADLALDFRNFRSSVAAHGSSLPANPAYEADEDRIVTAAAREFYRLGRAAMTAKRPKEAYRDFGTALEYVPGYADAAKRQADAYKAARSRVALLPFENAIGVRGLSQEMATQMEAHVPTQAGNMSFTEFVDGAAVENVMTVAQASRMSREDAMALGRKVGADRVVTGRYVGIRSNNDLKDLTIPIYRKVESKNDAGETLVRWVESSLHVVTREREVTVNWEYSVLDVKTGAVLLQRTRPAVAAARIVWTDFKPEGDCDRYTLLPPDVRREDSARARKVDQQWEERVGSWTLPALLVKSRDERNRSRWSTSYRGEFHGVDSRRRPVWLGELPGEPDLAFIALDGSWREVLAGLQELDARD